MAVSGVVPPDRPARVVQVCDAAGVLAALDHASAAGLGVTIRSGGHSTAFTALRDGALALDVSGLDDVSIDHATGTAIVGPGTTSLALAEALAGTGLAFPVGHRASVGLGGFLLAGGNGWNQGAWGSACESVLGAQVVLADGRRTSLDAQTDAEAFAVLRGAGPAFPAVVTAFRLRLWPEPTVRRRTARFRVDVRTALSDLAAAGRWADAFAADLAPEVELTLVLSPGEREEPPVVVASVTAFGRDGDHAEELLAPLGRCGPVEQTTLAPSTTSIPDLLRVDTTPTGTGSVAQQTWTRAGYAEVLPRLARPLAAAPSPLSSVLVSSASYRRAAAPATEPLHRPRGTLTVAAYSTWVPGVDDAANLAWPTAVVEPLADVVTGHYVGELDLRATPERIGRCWEPGGLARVAAVRARLDPAGGLVPPPGWPAVVGPPCSAVETAPHHQERTP
nr:FAD-binding oxidoreductase [Cellulosimicrobium arenosum]